MAEYSREQRNQLSRAVANNGTNSKQLKKNVDNSSHSIFMCNVVGVIQGYWGADNPTILCDAEIKYIKRGKRNKIKYSYGQGGSDAGTAKGVVNTFDSYGFAELGDVNQVANGNPPGQCAEPHAVADALKGLRNERPCLIEKITVKDARINRLTPSLINQGRRRGDIMPRCATCVQWIPGREVLPNYVKRKLE